MIADARRVISLPAGMSREQAVALCEDVARSWQLHARIADRHADDLSYVRPSLRALERERMRQRAATARDNAAKCLSAADVIARAEIIVVEG